jgi:hypothetical protein
VEKRNIAAEGQKPGATLGGTDALQKGFLTSNEALAYLAKILVEAYFKQKAYERTVHPQ